jgi:hypothetical protein
MVAAKILPKMLFLFGKVGILRANWSGATLR